MRGSEDCWTTDVTDAFPVSSALMEFIYYNTLKRSWLVDIRAMEFCKRTTCQTKGILSELMQNWPNLTTYIGPRSINIAILFDVLWDWCESPGCGMGSWTNERASRGHLITRQLWVDEIRTGRYRRRSAIVVPFGW